MRHVRLVIRMPALAGAVCLLLAGALIGFAPTVEAEEGFVNGSGKADARVLRAGPSASRLALAPSVSLALADFLGTQGRGEARAFDYAALEGNMPEELLNHYPTVKVESTQENSEAGTTTANPPFTQHANATAAPSGQGVATVDTADIPGTLRMSGGRAEAFARLVDVNVNGVTKKVREAGGVVDIGRVELGGGAAILNNLHWELVQRTDSNDDTTPEVTGSFTVGSVISGGQVTNGPIGADALGSVLGPLNTALASTGLGLQLTPPVLENVNGAARFTPMGIRIANVTAGNEVTRPLLEQLQPVREPLFQGIIDQCPECTAAILVGDLALGLLTGSGRLDIELGGVFGYTEGATFDDFILDELPPLEPIEAGFDTGGLIGGLTDAFAPLPATDPFGPSAGSRDVTRSRRIAAPAAISDSMKSAAWALGVLALALLIAAAYRQYRELRNRRRAVPAI